MWFPFWQDGVESGTFSALCVGWRRGDGVSLSRERESGEVMCATYRLRREERTGRHAPASLQQKGTRYEVKMGKVSCQSR